MMLVLLLIKWGEYDNDADSDDKGLSYMNNDVFIT